MRALLIVNPAAGKHPGVPEIGATAAVLEGAGLELQIVETSRDGPTAGDLAKRAVMERLDAVLVAGGDGTVQLAARALLDTGVPLGILPFGRAMNIARGLGIPLDDPVAAARVIARRNVRGTDVGEVKGEVFFESAGIGLDAQLFGAARAAEKGRWGRAFRRVLRWGSQGTYRISVRGERGEVSYRAMQVLVLNSPYYAWSFPIAGGDMHDGLLEVTVFPRMGRLTLVRNLVRLWRERLHEEPPIVLHEAKVRISANAPLAIHADGRLVGTLPAEFRCRAGALKVFVPEPEEPRG